MSEQKAKAFAKLKGFARLSYKLQIAYSKGDVKRDKD